MGEDGVSDAAIVDAALRVPVPSPETPSVQLAYASPPDPLQGHAKAAVTLVETPDECLAAEICIDRYLWSVYERALVQSGTKFSRQLGRISPCVIF
jgi:hypothetical protein